jgi:hypothetical protein
MALRVPTSLVVLIVADSSLQKMVGIKFTIVRGGGGGIGASFIGSMNAW